MLFRSPLHALTWVRKAGSGDNQPPPQGSGTMTSTELIKKLAAKGANLNARMPRNISVGMTRLNTKGATPFFLAARTADAEMMRLLAQLGADPKIPNDEGSTPLMAAAGLGTRSPGEDAGTEEEVVEAIQAALDLGNDINAVDAKGETSVAGVFAAGDCTTVPYKQIIIAMGEGAKASLGAFDYLIRHSVKEEEPAKIAA